MKYYLITGASTGIGYAITKALIEQGHFVFGSVRKQNDADRLKATFGANFYPLQFDVTDEAAVKKSVAIVKTKIGDQLLSGLINNAGIAVSGPLMHVPLEDFRMQLDVNVLGVFNVSKAFLPLLGATLPAVDHPARIINMSSVSGRIASPFVGPYAASKFALEAMTHSLRRELLIYGIDVVSIQPGPIKTPIWGKSIKDVEQFSGTDYEPLKNWIAKRIAKTEETAIPASKVADAVLKALHHPRPKLSYIVAANKWQYRLLYSFMPDRLMDYFVGKSFKKVMAYKKGQH